MTGHTEIIFEKMKGSDYSGLNFEFAYKLTNESERGAILIGASKVESYLDRLIMKILPLKQKKYTTRLLNYPGPLSSLSGKIELCFAFRIIDERVYHALTILRKIRNDAAHSDEMFSLKDLQDKLDEIYDFEDGFPQVVHKLSFENLLKWKKYTVKQSLLDKDLGEFDFEKIWRERLPNPEKDEAIQEQLRIWKLAYGLTLLCLKIEVINEEVKY